MDMDAEQKEGNGVFLLIRLRTISNIFFYVFTLFITFLLLSLYLYVSNQSVGFLTRFTDLEGLLNFHLLTLYFL